MSEEKDRIEPKQADDMKSVPTTPHTQSEENQRAFVHTGDMPQQFPDREADDVLVDALEGRTGDNLSRSARGRQGGAIRGEDAERTLDLENEGQEGTNRAPQYTAGHARNLHAEQEGRAGSGSVTTRAPHGDAQGITAHSETQESDRQQKVVSQREDARAGTNPTPRNAQDTNKKAS